ncbi:hypothetical protein [Bradyrhizobium sp. CCBAU 53415]|uniref:hypothetical protein n=1 Tax=Bradyrhizobium sp. CCBAU 53415 TaxID=1325119 RepID=UPI002FE23A53
MLHETARNPHAPWVGDLLAEGGHGWMQDRADPYERERAFDLTRFDIPQRFSPEEALAELRDV